MIQNGAQQTITDDTHGKSIPYGVDLLALIHILYYNGSCFGIAIYWHSLSVTWSIHAKLVRFCSFFFSCSFGFLKLNLANMFAKSWIDILDQKGIISPHFDISFHYEPSYSIGKWEMLKIKLRIQSKTHMLQLIGIEKVNFVGN